MEEFIAVADHSYGIRTEGMRKIPDYDIQNPVSDFKQAPS